MSLVTRILAPLERWRALHEMRSFDRQGNYGSRFAFEGMMTEATEFLERDLPGRAREVWSEAYRKSPEAAMTSAKALDLLLRLERYAEAEDLLMRGLKRYKRGQHFLEGLARIASRRGDRPESLRRSEVLQKKHPQSEVGYRVAAEALSVLGRIKEADATIARGLRFLPDNVPLWAENARLAERRQDWAEALERWNYVHETLGHMVGTVGVVRCLAHLKRYEEADAAVRAVLYKSGNQADIWIASAEVAENKEDWEEAVRRWDVVRARFPQIAIGYNRAVKPLGRLARPEAAQEILQAGLERLPDERSLHIAYSHLAGQLKDWTSAVERWATVRQRFPDFREAYEQGARALDALHRSAEAAALRAEISERAA